MRSLPRCYHKETCCFCFVCQEPEAGFTIPLVTWLLSTLVSYYEYSCENFAAILGTLSRVAFWIMLGLLVFLQ